MLLHATGVPVDIASIIGMPNPSDLEGKQSLSNMNIIPIIFYINKF